MSPETSSRPTAAAALRRAFLDWFVARGHTAVPSAPMIPGDPSLLFTTAGMVQFKPYYSAVGEVPYTRVVSVQKCLRLTDLENVGATPRHCTFFEMLGNFSFGPREQGAYFKEEAIALAWEFVTQVLGLPRQRLYASVFAGEAGLPRDDEAETLWKRVGLASDHIVALGRADNFWGPAGGSGPCGPCSEIYFDLGEKHPAHLPAGVFWGERPGDAGDRYMEFWNLVFPQFDAQPDGGLVPLARPGIDTGMGLERLALLQQEKTMVFETDAFAPLVDQALGFAHATDRDERGARLAARILADHARALAFAVAEGALPGNEGAGYVLRRLLRRAVARGRSRRGLAVQGVHQSSFMGLLCETVIEAYGSHYAELARNRDAILRVIRQEEQGFGETYQSGIERLESLLGAVGGSIAAEDAFALHDTYGFPIELTEEIARERGAEVDRQGFERAMEEQRRRARAASRFGRADGAAGDAWTIVTEGPDSAFVGYHTLQAEGLTLRRWRRATAGDGARADRWEVVLDRTPCYAEAGGQVADRGALEAGGVRAGLTHVLREGDSIVHGIRASERERDVLLEAGARGALAARVDPGHRLPTMRHHTATHLLHAVLRQALGTHVRQAGSLVAPDRLRFDYTHFEAPAGEQLARIEDLVVEWVLRDQQVGWEVMPLERARALGAMALFGEKYGAEVRVVTVLGAPEAEIPTSRELCGGTHVTRTGEIGAFVVVAEAAIASGLRRIEALAGREALQWLKARAATLDRAAALFQSRPEAVPEQIEKLRAELERLRRAEAATRRGGLEAEMARLAQGATAAAGGRWLVAVIESDAEAGTVRDAADRLRGTLGRGAALLAVRGGGKLAFVAAVSGDLVAEGKLRADELVRRVAQVTGGSGGGKPHLALAGGKDATRLDAALDEARRLLAAALAG
jgi:alanyl-tRNA synthetase